MVGQYCNLAIKVQLILKMQLICSLLKNLSFKIIRRLASLLPGKTRRHSYITMLYFFAVKTSILSFSSPPARKVMRERNRAPRAGHLPRGWQFSLISRVHWCVHLADTPFECYFTKVIPLTTFDDFRDPPPPFRLHFPSKFE